MPDHKCPHEGDIAKLIEKVDRTFDEVFGNGKDGQKLEIDRLKKKVSTMTDEFKKIATSISALAQTQVEQAAIEGDREENRRRRTRAWERFGIITAAVFGGLGALKLILDFVG